MGAGDMLVRFGPDLKAELAAEAARTDRTQAQVVRRALRIYLTLPEDQRR